MPRSISEADLIEIAYEDQVKVLYKNLLTGLQDGGSDPTPDVEQRCLRHFTMGLRMARRARELALSASTAAPARAPPAAAQTALPGKKTTKRSPRPPSRP
jgi:hypothetical protein